MAEQLIGIIGGSGLYQMKELTVLQKIASETPFGKPSGDLVLGELVGARVVFLPRHGSGHSIPPTDINFRANIFAMKKLGVARIVSVSAVGSMKEGIAPGHFVTPHQFIDRTFRRVSTFFSPGLVGHVGFSDPICLDLAKSLAQAANRAGATVHEGGTYICIEGPQFSTRAESLLYRQWGVDVIGMTNVTEAKLAREAGICYSTLALVTDYDCWHEEEAPVTLEAVLETIHQNVELAQVVIKEIVPAITDIQPCACHSAADNAIVTDRKIIPERLKRNLSILFGKL